MHACRDEAAACVHALANLFMRAIRRAPRLEPVRVVGEAGMVVAAHVCQQALNRSQGSDGCGAGGFSGGVFYTDISCVESCEDTLSTHVALLLAAGADDACRSKETLLVLSGCEHHLDSLLQALFIRLLTAARGLIVCAVGTAVSIV